MASADLISELTAQVDKEKHSKSSKNEPVLKSVKGMKTEADKIDVIDDKPDDSVKSGKADKNKQKAGFFYRVKRFVARKSGTSSTVKHNGNSLKDNNRTKSTSDLDDNRTSGNNEKRVLGAGSDEHLYSQDDTVKSDTDEKQSGASNRVSGFFGRKLKIRSSWKPKLKLPRKKRSSSRPVSPLDPTSNNKEPAEQLASKLHEIDDLAAINETFHDDSFFQVSLDADSKAANSQIDQSLTQNDINFLDTSVSSVSRPSGADDKIRLAPKGRRKPTRFNSKTNTVQSTDPSSSCKETENVQLDVQTKFDSNKGIKEFSVEDDNKDAINENSSSVGLQEDEKMPSSSNYPNETVIIHTPEDKKSIQVKEKRSVANENDLGSWENLSIARSNSSLEKNENTSQLLLDTSNNEKSKIDMHGENSEPVVHEIKAYYSDNDSKNHEKTFNETTESSTDKAEVKRVNEVEKTKLQDGDHGTDKDEVEVEQQSCPVDEKSNNPEEKKVDFPLTCKRNDNVIDSKETTEQGKDMQEDNEEGSSGKEELVSTVFDTMVARAKRGEKEAEEETKTVKSTADALKESNVEKKQAKKLSFDMNDLDDMRSADLQPMVTPSSDSSPTKNQATHDASGNTNSDTCAKSQNEQPCAVSSNSIPSWVAIAKEKHKRNALDEDDENEAEEDQEEKPNLQAAEKSISAGASKPTVDRKPSLSKIPKPSFKSQSFKGTTSTTPSKLPSRNAKSVKVSSPISICIACDKPVYQSERCDIDGQISHKNCAKCSMCSRTINVGTIRVVNNKLYCGIHVRSAVS